MKRQDKADRILAVAERNIERGAEQRTATEATWLTTAGVAQQNEAIILLLKDMGERMLLIETALGLMAAKKSK